MAGYRTTPAYLHHGKRPPTQWDRFSHDTKTQPGTIASTPVTTTASIKHINIIAQGVQSSRHVSDWCRLVFVEMNAIVSSKTSTTANMCVGYWVWDYEPTGTLPAYTDIFESSSPFAWPLTSNRQRFTIMPIFKVCFPFNAGVGTSAYRIPTELWEMPQDAYTQYTRTDTTGVLANIVRGALYLVLLGSDPAGATQGDFEGRYRMHFIDASKSE